MKHNLTPNLPYGTRVLITSTPHAGAQGQEGTIVHPFENGYAVATKIAGRPSTVWAERVEPVQNPLGEKDRAARPLDIPPS